MNEGLVEVVKRNQNKDNADVIRLVELEETAKSAGNKGKWTVASKRRTLLPEVENGGQLVGKSLTGIVEHVRDGSTLRVGLLMAGQEQSHVNYLLASVMLSGVRCPQTSEPFGEEARYFTESRLLHREVKVRLEQFAPNGSFVASVAFIDRDIAEYLVREGYAKCLDRTLSLTADPKKLRLLEKEAKSKKLRVWHDLKESAPRASSAAFDARVVEVVNAEALMVVGTDSKEAKKIFLASIRAPRLEARAEGGESVPVAASGDRRTFRPLYDIPFMFEAREFLRKRLIGKTVKVKVDYVQPKQDNFPEKLCCTVSHDGQNVAELLVARGLATVARHRQDDDQRASDYDAFLAAELKAQKNGKGLYSSKTDAGLVRIADLSSDLSKSKNFAQFLTRASGVRRESVVEFVFPSSTKLKVYIPKDNCLVNLILSGVNTPKFNDPILPEAVNFARLKVLQHDVHTEIETVDKAGNYIGSLYYDKGNNLALDLVRQGYLSVREYNKNPELNSAQKEAQTGRRGIWKDFKEEEEVAENGTKLDGEEAEETGAVPSKADDLARRRKVVVTNCAADFSSFHAQEVGDGPKIEELLSRLRKDVQESPPLSGAYKPKKGDLVMARFSEDQQWYRAKVTKLVNADESQVLFLDYGNSESLKNSEIASLPLGNYSSLPAFAKQYGFAFVFADTDDEMSGEARSLFIQATVDRVMLLKTEYKDANSGLECATLLDEASKNDVVLQLVTDGWLFVDTKTRRERRLAAKLAEYKEAQETAKKDGVSRLTALADSP